MAFNIYYSGSFVSRLGHTIKVDILRDADAPSEVGELSFPAETPLTVEWSADSKRETIQGSTATLTIISPGDRTYLGLYTSEVGSVRMDAYRDGNLWWSGTLDTEFYEEPYSSAKNYDVTLTFEDFGSLDRLMFGLTAPVVSLNTIMADALTRLNLATGAKRTLMMSTQLNASTGAELSRIYIRTDNFTDEDGETQSMADVVEAILQPLDLHVRQWAGNVYIFDNHTMAQQTTEIISWDSDDQVLSVDEVANAVKVTYSPYAQSALLSDDAYASTYTWANLVDSYKSISSQGVVGNYEAFRCATWLQDNSTDNKISGKWDSDYVGFYLTVGKDQTAYEGLADIGGCYPAHFESYGNGETCDCLMAYVYGNSISSGGSDDWGLTKFTYTTSLTGETLMQLNDIYMPTRPSSGTYYARLELPLLLSARYNPFGDVENTAEASNCEKVTYRAGFVLIPFRAELLDDSGDVIYHYCNYTSAHGVINNSQTPTLSNSQGSWISGEYNEFTSTSFDRVAFLSYHATEDRKTTNGIDGGWCTNRHFVGLNKKAEYTSFKDLPEGQYIPLPPVGGRVRITIYTGIYIYDWGNSSSTDTTILGDVVSTTQALYAMMKWHGYKCPTVSLVRYQGGQISEIDSEDIEYTGTLLATAKDDISIDTTCGTSATPIAGARGAYLDSSSTMLTSMVRNGRATTVEQLLIGTLHSHYASRHAVLTGTMLLSDTTSRLPLYTDEALALPMVMTTATADLITDTCEATLIEVNEDCYSDE